MFLQCTLKRVFDEIISFTAFTYYNITIVGSRSNFAIWGFYEERNKKWKTTELFPNKKFGYYKENETTTRKIIFKANNVALFIWEQILYKNNDYKTGKSKNKLEHFEVRKFKNKKLI